ncbi:hypothetical protein [Ruminococcus sp. 5_1_39BFAA]|uniref:hypothetical protein n=1 Tax=Ruminococcus sp. 5_1_39BFAA TaxID=457412 RepID=UPI003569C427
MAEYQAIYKCRLCGEEYSGGRTGAAIAISETTKIAVDGVGIHGTRLHGTHNCDDGSCGLADFLGFRKVE